MRLLKSLCSYHFYESWASQQSLNICKFNQLMNCLNNLVKCLFNTLCSLANFAALINVNSLYPNLSQYFTAILHPFRKLGIFETLTSSYMDSSNTMYKWENHITSIIVENERKRRIKITFRLSKEFVMNEDRVFLKFSYIWSIKSCYCNTKSNIDNQLKKMETKVANKLSTMLMKKLLIQIWIARGSIDIELRQNFRLN
jgi:hypothetical protein